MGFARKIGNFVIDWRNGATLLASVLVALLVVTVLDGLSARHEALDAATATANQARSAQKAASRRIDQLTTGQQRLTRQVGMLIEENAALSQQIRDMGGRPTVVPASQSRSSRVFVAPEPTPAPSPRATSSPAPRPSSSPRPSPSPSPSPTCRPLPLLGCRGAR